MNFGELINWGIGIILAWSTIAHVNEIHRNILKAQAHLIYESRTETWGTPNLWNYRSTQNSKRNYYR